jgi:hypothetical protein
VMYPGKTGGRRAAAEPPARFAGVLRELRAETGLGRRSWPRRQG